jgi:hypothetical protein
MTRHGTAPNRREPWQAEPPRGPLGLRWYHGTSTTMLDRVLAGSRRIAEHGGRSVRSVQGAYLTTDPETARSYAREACRFHGGRPVVLEVRPRLPLLADEDWVVNAVDEDTREPAYHGAVLAARYDPFFRDLFTGHDPHRLLFDHYRKHRARLDRKHGITWRDSWRFLRTARQTGPLSADQVLAVMEVAR